MRSWRGDAELDIGAPQQGAVLAMPLLAEGRQITLDALISGLWDDDAPPGARGTVRTYLSRPRRPPRQRPSSRGCGLHDIGCTPEPVETGFHPLDGARYLRRVGIDGPVVSLVAYPSCVQIEADVRGR